MERVIQAQTIIHAVDDMTGTVFESNSDDVEQRSQPSLTNVAESWPDSRSMTEHVLSDLVVMEEATLRGLPKVA